MPFRDSITTCTCSIRGKSRLSPTLSYCIFYNTHPSAWTMYVYTCIYATHYSQETSIGFHFLVIVCAFHNEQFVNFYLYTNEPNCDFIIRKLKVNILTKVPPTLEVYITKFTLQVRPFLPHVTVLFLPHVLYSHYYVIYIWLSYPSDTHAHPGTYYTCGTQQKPQSEVSKFKKQF